MGQKQSFVSALLNASNGATGELTCILTYIFQSLIVRNDEFGKELRDKLFEIADDEMNHFEMLNEILIDMGVVPYIVNANKKAWCSSNVNYETDVYKFLKQNIYGEEYAIKDYEKIRQMTTNQKYIQMIDEIIKDEKKHKEIFEYLLEKINAK